jgi:hypothetical protein
MTVPDTAARARAIVQQWFDTVCTSPIPVDQLRTLDDAVAAGMDGAWNEACEAIKARLEDSGFQDVDFFIDKIKRPEPKGQP